MATIDNESGEDRAFEKPADKADSRVTGAARYTPTTVNKRGSNLDSLRRNNLSLVMRDVHHTGGITRSGLARQTGLNRSTIAVLVNELADLGLVEESTHSGGAGVGRPSSIVRPQGRTVAIAIFPEIDAITVGIVGLGGTVHNRIRYETVNAPSVRETVNITTVVLKTILGSFTPSPRVVGIGVAVPGLVRDSDGRIQLAPHLGWHDEPLAELLEAATGYPAAVANDAGLGTVAEAQFGAGRGMSDMIYVNGGVGGIGGGIISNGQTLRGAEGYAGQFGQMFVASPIVSDGIGAGSTLETAVSRATLLEVLGLTTSDPDLLEQALLSSSDPQVHAEVARQLDFLGLGLGNAINILNPQVVVLGGFLGSLYAADPDRLWTAVKSRALFASRAGTRIRRAELGSNLLMVGAGELAFSRLLDDPAGFKFTSDGH